MMDYSDPNNAYGFRHETDNFNVRKMIRNRTDKRGLTKVLIEVCQYTYGGTGQYETKFRRIATDVWIKPKNWNQTKELVIPAEQDAEVKNKDIDKVYVAVKAYINSKGLQSIDQAYVEALNLGSLAEFFPSRKENRRTLVDYLNDYIELRRSKGTIHNTLKEFITVKNRIKNFDEKKNKKTYFENIDLVWSDNFELWLRNEAKNGKKLGYDAGTVEKTYTVLITMLNHFYKRRKQLQISLSDDFMIKNPDGFKRGTKSINEANPLSEKQRITLYEHKFKEKHLVLTKDRFIWQCYTGIRYGDAFNITKNHILEKVLYYTPSKTSRYKIKIEQPLNDVAFELLEKYDFDMRNLKITNQAYNRDLKEMFQKMQKEHPDLEYESNYGTHCGRDTFVSMCVAKGVDWKTILKWVGQSSYRIMDRYIKLAEEYDKQQMKKINSKVLKRK